SPIVKDVVFARSASDVTDSSKWHTVLVAGLGGQRGYYALDVTKPYIDAGSAYAAPPANGPHFLWQQGNLPGANNQLFGKFSATPAVTTVYISDGGTLKEVGVAILPGGSDSAPQPPPASCQRDIVSRGPTATEAGPAPSTTVPFLATPTSGWRYRNNVRQWGS